MALSHGSRIGRFLLALRQLVTWTALAWAVSSLIALVWMLVGSAGFVFVFSRVALVEGLLLMAAGVFDLGPSRSLSALPGLLTNWRLEFTSTPGGQEGEGLTMLAIGLFVGIPLGIAGLALI